MADTQRDAAQIDTVGVTEEKAAELLMCSSSTLKQLRYAGKGPVYFKLSDTEKGGVRYRPKDLDAWAASRLQRNTADQPGGAAA